ncbi:MAG: filamentous hemagglutinin family N-terminal domain protein [Burkholderiaceae bacterium]|nr:filamentous hemagglutinin family N-terminal domain protein [Burkholderiaceae bacterium]
MNKHAYKLVFNQTRGMMVAVSEVALNHSKEPNSGQTQGSSGHTSGTVQRIKHGMVMLLMAFQIWQPLLAAPVAITPDNTQAGSKPTVTAANNGVPVVNIIAPNAQGVSINQYRDYNVPTVGLILNNSGGTSLTQLGGYIQGNPMLGNRAASTIVNQVNGPNRSLILGAQEIAGQRANLILANQNGVSINGGSFINTANVTLTTGAPQYNNGALAGYAVKDGLIDVGAGGLDASTTDKLTILTRAAQINGQIWAKQAELITGQNQISFDAQGNHQATANPSSTGTTPTYALDVSAVGGMYAGQMRIIGTEQGLGVNNAGQLISAGELSLDAQGNLTNSGRMDSGADSHLHVAALDNSGQISAVNNLTLNNQTRLNNSGQLMAGSVQIDTQSLNNTGILNQTGVQNMDITAQNLNNTGTVGITADTNTPTIDPSTGQAQVSNSSAPQTSTGETTSSAGQITTNPVVLNNGHIHVAQDLNNPGQLLTGGALTVHVADTLSNTGAVRTANTLNLQAQQINNQTAATIASQTGASLNATALNNQGKLQAQTLAVTANTIDNRQGSITGEQSLTLNAAQTIDNTQGQIESGALTLNTNELNNTRGAIIAQGTSNLSATQINNTQGLVFAKGAQSIQAQQLTNTAGLIQGQTLNIQAAQIDNSAAIVNQATVSGTLIGLDGLSISGNVQLNNNGGIVQSNQVTIDSQTIQNQAGQLIANQGLTVHADSLNNQKGLVYANQTVGLTVGAIDNQNTAESSQTGTSTGIQAQTVTVQGNSTLNNTAGQIIGNTIQVGTQSLNNSSGFVVGNTVNLNATQLNNQNGTVLADQLNLTSSNYTHQGMITANDAATLNLTGDFTNQGSLQALGDLSLHTDGNITNTTGSTLSASNTLALAGQNITNQSAANIHATHTQLTAQDSIVNDGTIDGGLTELRAGNQIINNYKIYGGDFNGNGGILIGTGNLINNTNAVIASRADMNIGAVNITNDINGLIQSQGDMSIGRTLGSAAEGYAVSGMSDRLDNQSARIEVGGNAKWDIANLQNSNMQFAWGTVDGTPIHQVIYKLGGQELDSSQVRLYFNGQYYDANTPVSTMGSEDYFRLVTPSETYPFEIYGPFIGGVPFTYSKPAPATNTISDEQYENLNTASTTGTTNQGSFGFILSGTPKVTLAYYAPARQCTSSGGRDSVTVCSGVKPERYTYEPNDAIWQKFNVIAPDSAAPSYPVKPIEPVTFLGTCSNPTGTMVQKCATYQQELQQYEVDKTNYQNWLNRNFNQYVTLNNAITAFNNDIASRSTQNTWDFSEWDIVTANPVVTQSNPAHIIIGSNATINGSITNAQSQIIVGGTLDGSAQDVNNIGQDANKITRFDNAKFIHTYTEKRGTFSGSSRYYSTINADVAPIIETVHLSVAETKTNVGSQNIASVAGTRNGEGTATDIAAPASVQTVPTDNGQEIRTVAFNGILPSNVLFNVANDPNANYIVETDPQYTNKQQFLSSNYLLQQYDPDHIWKRIGDGYYEQKLITDQIITATGKRYVGDYSNNEAQYKALMDNGLAVGKAFSLTVGTALTAEQMSQLTTDIIWMVEETVTLADGTKVKALVPRVYLTSNSLDLKGDGTLIASKNNFLNVTGDVNNNGGTIAAFKAMDLAANTINNKGGTMGGNAGSDITLRTQGDFNNIGGTVRGGNLALDVGGNLNSITTTYHTQTGDMNLKDRRNYASVRDGIDQVASIQALDDNHSFKDAQGNTVNQTALNIQAQGDINLKASAVSSAGDAYTSAQNINLTTVDTGFAENAVYNWSSKNKHRTERSDTAEVGSILTAVGNNILVADHDINAKAASVNADTGALIAVAGNDINITNGTATHADSSYTYKKRSGLLSSTRTTDSVSNHSTTATGTEFTGTQVILDAGHDANITGSSVVSDNLTRIHADNDINILNATDTQGGTQFHETKKSGFSLSLATGLNYNKSSLKEQGTWSSTNAASSSVLGENVAMSSGRDTNITGSQVIADKDVNVSAGRDINVMAAENTNDSTYHMESKSLGIQLIGGLAPSQTQFSYNKQKTNSAANGTTATTSLLSANTGDLTLKAGLDKQYAGTGSGNITTEGADLLAKQKVDLSGNAVTLGESAATQHSETASQSKSFTIGSQLSGTLGSKITDTYNMAQAAREGTGNSRLDGAMALKAGYDAYKLANTLIDLASSSGGQSGDNASGSAIGVSASVNYSKSESKSSDNSKAIQGTNIQASDISITAREGDLTAVAAKLQAENIDLSAAKDVNLLAGVNSAEMHSSNKGSSVGAGVTVGVGQQTGISFQLGASTNRGNANGSETTYDNTQVTATNTLKVTSGNDTNLIGAQVAGKSVKMDVGGDLNITTLQDTSEYKSKQQSGGFNLSICVPPICYGQTVSGSVNYAQTKINHDYQSATGQSGIAAGEGGFDITVHGNTALNGAAMTSQASADQNSLTTGSLSYTDLANHQTTEASSVSVSAGTSGNAYLQMAQNALANLAGAAGLPKDMDESSQTRSVISPANIKITGDTSGISQANAAELTSRDASTANQSLSNTLKLQDVAQMEQEMKQAQQNAQAANLVGAVLTNVIGDVAQDFNKQAQLAENARAQAAGESPKEVSTWADGSVEKMLLHGLAGLIQAKVAGGDLSIGLAAGAMNEALIPVMTEFLAQQGVEEWVKDANGNTVKNPNYAGLMQLGSTLAGAALGAVAGSVQDASLAANVAKNATENNWLAHEQARRRAQLREKKYSKGGLTPAEESEFESLNKTDAQNDQLYAQACGAHGEKKDSGACQNYVHYALAPVIAGYNASNTEKAGDYGLGSIRSDYDLIKKDIAQTTGVKAVQPTIDKVRNILATANDPVNTAEANRVYQIQSQNEAVNARLGVTENNLRGIGSNDAAASEAAGIQNPSLIGPSSHTVFGEAADAFNAQQDVYFQKCDASNRCSIEKIDPQNIRVGSNGKVYVFNNGINNDLAASLANAQKQSTPEANQQGVYLVYQKTVGIGGDLTLAAWNKIVGWTGARLPVSEATKANEIILDAAKQQGGKVVTVNHSQGTQTINNGLLDKALDGKTDVPIDTVILNGGAANAQSVSNTVNQVTSGQGVVKQSTHPYDGVSGIFGNNPATQQNGNLGITDAFGAAHTTYGPNIPKIETNKAWGKNNVSVPIIVTPTNGRQQ